MSTTTTTTLEASLQKISSKSGKPLAEVKASFQSALNSLPPEYTGQTREKYALKLVNRDLSVNTRSQAIAFEGIIIGIGQQRDFMKGIREAAIQEYRTNREQSLASGSVREEGDKIVVLDNRKEINGKPNKNFGKPRPEHMFVKDLIIAVRKPGETAFTPGRLQLRGDQTSVSTPLGKLVSFKALGELQDGEYNLRSSVVTQFEIATEIPFEKIIGHIDQAFKTHFVKLGDCMKYHKSLEGSPQFWNRYVITEGTVAYVKHPTDPSKSILIALQDDSLETTDGVTVWLPNNLRGMLNFGRDSVVTLVAQTMIGKGWNRETQQQTDEERIMLNAYSIFGRPGLTTIVDEPGEML